MLEMVVKVSDSEMGRIRRLAEKAGGAVTPAKIRAEVGWTAAQWYARKHLVEAAGVAVASAGEITRRAKDTERGETNLRALEWALYTRGLYGGFLDMNAKTALRALRSMGVSREAADGIANIAKWEPDEGTARLLVRALGIPWRRYAEMVERHNRAEEESYEEGRRKWNTEEEREKRRAEADEEIRRITSPREREGGGG